MKHRFSFILLAVCAAFASHAQQQVGDSASLCMPLIFEQYYNAPQDQPQESSPYTLDAGDQWLQEAIARGNRYKRLRFDTMVGNPSMVRYNIHTLPEPPKEQAIKGDPSKALLTVAPPSIAQPEEQKIEEVAVKLHDWLHEFKGSLHFTQAYISSNWYQGGENNINILAISTSPIRLSVVVDSDQCTQAVQCLHTAFGLDADEVFEEKALSAEEIAAKMNKGR